MGKVVSRLVAAMLVFSTFVLPEALLAREKRGAEVIVTLKDGHYTVGELIAVKPGSLLILAEKDVSVELAEIRSVRVVKRSKALLGLGCGVLVGVVASVIYRSRADDILEAIDMMGAAVLLVGGGMGVGLGAGALAGKDKVLELEGKSELEVKRALSYLRRQARIRIYYSQ
jgi:small nuclear ribonucleoprotein (snRNP)-like protein